jgi:radical SAM protein with 4Fe4S-binding SPASM domain
MLYKDWLKAIKEAEQLGCKTCQFIGGEPLLFKGENGETVFDLAAYARKVGFSSIEIYTNATLLTPGKIRLIKELGLKVAVSLYSNDPIIHDSITQTPGSYVKTMHSLESIKKCGVETRVETIVMKANQETIDSTRAFIREMGLQGRKPDPVRPNGRGEKKLIQPDDKILIQYGFILIPNFKASKNKITTYRSNHPCLSGKMAITEFGDILPCIFERNHILGNYLAQKSLSEIVDSSILQSTWHTTKDDVAVCQDCEYRYVCFDCRPIAETAAEGRASFQNAPYPRCTYNPYSGEWGNGVWKVDLFGKPFYDQSLAMEIKQVRQLI